MESKYIFEVKDENKMERISGMTNEVYCLEELNGAVVEDQGHWVCKVISNKDFRQYILVPIESVRVLEMVKLLKKI